MKKSAQLSQDQLKKSISAKQSKAKLKNVLAQPCPMFWPLLPNSSCGTFRSILRATLPEPSTGNATKAMIKDSKSLIYGLTCVHRNLKAGKVDSLILSASIQPTFVIQQILQQALTIRRDLRVICIENLEDILKDVGLQSTAIGLINQSSANAFSQLHSFIEREFEKFPIPDGFFRHNNHQDPVVEQKEQREKPKSLLAPTFVPSSLYVYKKFYGKDRAFVPPQEHRMDTIAVPGMKSPTKVTKSLTNLSIVSKDIRKSKKKRTKKTPYLPMVINRIHPNPSSKKRAKKTKKKH